MDIYVINVTEVILDRRVQNYTIPFASKELAERNMKTVLELYKKKWGITDIPDGNWKITTEPSEYPTLQMKGLHNGLLHVMIAAVIPQHIVEEKDEIVLLPGTILCNEDNHSIRAKLITPFCNPDAGFITSNTIDVKKEDSYDGSLPAGYDLASDQESSEYYKLHKEIFGY